MKMHFLLLILIFYSQFSFSDDIILTADLWCPYTCDAKSANPGFMVEIVKEVFLKAGHKVNYVVINWARAISETRNNKFNGIIGASKTDAPDFIFTSVPIGYSSNFFWAKKEASWEYKNTNSLKGLKIGVINSYSYGDEVDKPVLDKNPSFVVVSGETALTKIVKMTDAKRLDGFVENPFVLDYLLRDIPELKNKFKSVSKNITKDTDLFVAFSPHNPMSKKYEEILSSGMKNLRKTGKLKTILNKYGLKDWK